MPRTSWARTMPTSEFYSRKTVYEYHRRIIRGLCISALIWTSTCPSQNTSSNSTQSKSVLVLPWWPIRRSTRISSRMWRGIWSSHWIWRKRAVSSKCSRCKSTNKWKRARRARNRRRNRWIRALARVSDETKKKEIKSHLKAVFQRRHLATTIMMKILMIWCEYEEIGTTRKYFFWMFVNGNRILCQTK